MDIFIGGLVAIISSVVTHVATKWLREHGKVYCYVESWYMSLIKSETNSVGDFIRQKVSSPEDADRIDYGLTIDLFNNSEVPVVLREIKFMFKRDGNSVVKFPNISGGYRVIGDDSYNQNIFVNLQSKQMTRLTFDGQFFKKDEFSSIAESSAVYLIANYHNGKRFKCKVSNLKTAE